MEGDEKDDDIESTSHMNVSHEINNQKTEHKQPEKEVSNEQCEINQHEHIGEKVSWVKLLLGKSLHVVHLNLIFRRL